MNSLIGSDPDNSSKTTFTRQRKTSKFSCVSHEAVTICSQVSKSSLKSQTFLNRAKKTTPEKVVEDTVLTEIRNVGHQIKA